MNDGRFLEYQRFLREHMIARLRVGCLLVAVLLPFGFVLDFATHPENWKEFLAIRLAAGAVGFGLFFVARYWNNARDFAFALSLVLSLSAAGAIEAMIIVLGPHDSGYYAGLNLVLLGVGLLFPWTMKQMAIVC